MSKRRRTSLEKAVDRELIDKGKQALKEFDKSQAIHIPAKRRDSKLISIRLPVDMLQQLRDMAQQRGDIGYQQLIKSYLADGLARDNSSTSLEAFQLFLRSYVAQMKSSHPEHLYVWYSGQTASGEPAKFILNRSEYSDWHRGLCERIEAGSDVKSHDIELSLEAQ
jgi:predicted DNA binding CopG/RHH family protein